MQIYILLYKEVALALKINSVYSKKRLLSIHENVRVLRYPDHFSTGVYLWYVICLQLFFGVGDADILACSSYISAVSDIRNGLNIGPTMKNLSLLIIRFAISEDWIYALAVMIQLSTKWVIALLCYGLERTIITRGKLLFSKIGVIWGIQWTILRVKHKSIMLRPT